MSDPDPHQPTRRFTSAVPPAGPPPPGTPPPAQPMATPAAPPPVVAPVAQPQPLYAPGTPVAPVAAAASVPVRLGLDAGRYWAGVVATAVVAALVAVVGVVVLQEILGIDLIVQDVFGTGSEMVGLVLGAVVAALVAGALLQLLVVTTPRPRAFFGWIMGLGTLVVALLPITWTDDVTSAVATGLVHLLIGIAVWSLLTGVLARTRRAVPAA